jgi:hypothetical protein
MQTTPGYMQTSPTFPMVRKGPISMGGKGDGGMYQGYGLTPSADYMTSLGSMANLKDVDFDKMSQTEKTALAGVLGATLIATTLWTFAVGPWAVKQFKPEWSYGKRLVTSFIAAAILRIGRGLVAPKEA